MKDWLQFIPNFFKGMMEVMKETQERARGGWKGKVVFWVSFSLFVVVAILFILWGSKAAYDNFADMLSHFNVNINQVNVDIPSSFFWNFLFALLITIFDFVILAGIAFVIAAFFATFTSLVFSPFTTRRIDSVFNNLLPIVTRIHELNPTDESKNILNETTSLHNQWKKSKFNNFIRRTTTKKEREQFDKRKI